VSVASIPLPTKVMLATLSFEHSLLNTLFNTHSFIGLNHCGSILWKLNLDKMVGHTLISTNKIVSARERVEK